MPITLLEARLEARARLNELTARAWEDYELDVWLNEGARDIGRRAEAIQEINANIRVLAGASKYQLPDDVVRIHRIEFVSGTNQYALTPSTYQEMDGVWGNNQTSQSSWPEAFVMWGMPPNLTLQLYPVPSQNGSLNVFYYRVPIKAVRPNDLLEIPEGWYDCLTLYCEYNAKRRDKDDTWKEAKILYEETVSQLIAATRQWHDQAQAITMGNRYIPWDLYAMEDY